VRAHRARGALHSRRDFLAVVGAAAAGACVNWRSPEEPKGGGSPRLTARVSAPTQSVTPGTYQITATNPNDGFLVVPSSYVATRPMPLLVSFHGAGEGAESIRVALSPYAESRGFLLLAIGARGMTWDVFTYKYSYDIAFIDSALAWAFARCNVDAARVAVNGFSDGASYALGVGLGNGDLFSRVIAWSPGFVPNSDAATVGKPRFFISHGTQDGVLRIDGASRVIVPDLKGRGYDVTYVEFDGGHTAPASVVGQSFDWMMA
jgi:phospholipase/carboxylesterase